jgi:curli production assembly/transport component CsgF
MAPSLKVTVSALFLVTTLPAVAGTLIYIPVNPNFGGSPFNGAWLQSQAAAEKPGYKGITYDQTKGISGIGGLGGTQLSPGQQFAQQLTSQIYSSLANKIVSAIFGANAQTSGTYSFGGTTISFVTVGNNIQITINDGQTITTVTVPKTS